jgi:hypothetical protein
MWHLSDTDELGILDKLRVALEVAFASETHVVVWRLGTAP